MTAPRRMLHCARVVPAAITVLALLVLPATASAKRPHASKDRNHDGIPDKWAKRYHLGHGKGMAKADPDKDGLTNLGEFLSGTNPDKADTNGNGVGDANEDPDGDHVDNGNEIAEHTNPQSADSNGNGVKDGSEDADHDKLNNAGEDSAGTDPMNPDTDGDGIKDGQERAGEIISFDGTTLTLRLFGGNTLSGTVDQDTYIDCGQDSSSDASGDSSDSSDPAADGWGDTNPDEKVVARDDPSTDGSASDPGADTSGDSGASSDSGDLSGDGSGGCATDTLKPGAVVDEADVSYTSKGAFFDAIQLGR